MGDSAPSGEKYKIEKSQRSLITFIWISMLQILNQWCVNNSGSDAINGNFSAASRDLYWRMK